MTSGTPLPTGQTHGQDPRLTPPRGTLPVTYSTDGALSRRLFAYLIDLLMIGLLSGILSIVIGILGILTFGFGWMLFGLLPLTAIVYNAMTIGGPNQATIGMRVMDLKVVDAATGGPVGMLVAAVHALLFYLAVGTFVIWAVDIMIGLVRDDRRIGHDILTGVVVVRNR